MSAGAVDDFLQRLRQLCLAFDAEHGSYPEHEYEGLMVLEFAMERAGHLNPDIDADDWSQLMKAVKGQK